MSQITVTKSRELGEWQTYAFTADGTLLVERGYVEVATDTGGGKTFGEGESKSFTNGQTVYLGKRTKALATVAIIA